MPDLNDFSVGTYHLCVPCGAVFGDTLHSPVVDIDQSEAVVIAAVRLVVVREGPVEIAPHRQAVQTGLFQCAQIAVQEIDPVGIVHASVQEDPVIAALPVLCDVDRYMVALKDQARSPVQNFGSHRPFEGSAGIARIFFLHTVFPRLILYQPVAVVDIEAGKVDRR